MNASSLFVSEASHGSHTDWCGGGGWGRWGCWLRADQEMTWEKSHLVFIRRWDEMSYITQCHNWPISASQKMKEEWSKTHWGTSWKFYGTDFCPGQHIVRWNCYSTLLLLAFSLVKNWNQVFDTACLHSHAQGWRPRGHARQRHAWTWTEVCKRLLVAVETVVFSRAWLACWRLWAALQRCVIRAWADALIQN